MCRCFGKRREWIISGCIDVYVYAVLCTFCQHLCVCLQMYYMCMRFAQEDPSWWDSLLATPVLIYYSNCASSTLIQSGISVTTISNSLLNCQHWDNQWTVNSETPGTVSATHLQEMKHLISLRSYDRTHYSTTFIDKSNTEIAIKPISHHVHRFGLISTVWASTSETLWGRRHRTH